MTIDNISFRIFNVAIDCNLDRTPWCLKQPSSSSIRFSNRKKPENRETKPLN